MHEAADWLVRRGGEHAAPHECVQEVVAIVHRHVAADFEVVEESEVLTDRVSGLEREVDAVIRGSTAGYEMVVSVEANARRRRAAVDWGRTTRAERQPKGRPSWTEGATAQLSRRRGRDRSALRFQRIEDEMHELVGAVRKANRLAAGT